MARVDLQAVISLIRRDIIRLKEDKVSSAVFVGGTVIERMDQENILGQGSYQVVMSDYVRNTRNEQAELVKQDVVLRSDDIQIKLTKPYIPFVPAVADYTINQFTADPILLEAGKTVHFKINDGIGTEPHYPIRLYVKDASIPPIPFQEALVGYANLAEIQALITGADLHETYYAYNLETATFWEYRPLAGGWLNTSQPLGSISYPVLEYVNRYWFRVGPSDIDLPDQSMLAFQNVIEGGELNWFVEGVDFKVFDPNVDSEVGTIYSDPATASGSSLYDCTKTQQYDRMYTTPFGSSYIDFDTHLNHVVVCNDRPDGDRALEFVAAQGGGTGLDIQLNFLNLSDGSEIEDYFHIPTVQTGAAPRDGLMSVADKLELIDLHNEVDNLKGIGRVAAHFGFTS